MYTCSINDLLDISLKTLPAKWCQKFVDVLGTLWYRQDMNFRVISEYVEYIMQYTVFSNIKCWKTAFLSQEETWHGDSTYIYTLRSIYSEEIPFTCPCIHDGNSSHTKMFWTGKEFSGPWIMCLKGMFVKYSQNLQVLWKTHELSWSVDCSSSYKDSRGFRGPSAPFRTAHTSTSYHCRQWDAGTAWERDGGRFTEREHWTAEILSSSDEDDGFRDDGTRKLGQQRGVVW